MESLESELDRARALDVADLADAVEAIGFECTRCGACCTAEDDDPHTATVFPDEVRRLQAATGDGWRDVARPMPYGLSDGPDGPSGETFEWALATDGCGDCTFYAEAEGRGRCTVHDDRPSICATYPFSVALGGTSQPMGEAVDEAGLVRAHECEGLGREISRTDAEELARELKGRAIRELEEAIAVRDRYRPVDPDPGEVVVHDSEGPKDRDGRPR
jgi:Fe-S-cluster containining protein